MEEPRMARYLIVDDDAVGRRLLEDFLSPYGQCDLASSGMQAIELFRRALEEGRRYDLICLDILMPGMGGHDVLRVMRALEEACGVFGYDGAKVIMITGVNDSKHCVRAFQEGCEGYITKPVREQRLLLEVQALLGELGHAIAPAGTHAHSPAAPPQPGRFLIVDDDRLCRELLKDMLSPHGHCDFAYNGQQAVQSVERAIAEGRPYNLMCLDILMPGLNGHEVLAAIRKIEADHGILGNDGMKVVMTTALRDSKECLRAFTAGCEAYVTKPVTQPALLARLNDLGVLAE
jgi:two-component system, chemotaxis family, chemotaxis protein CheY